MAAQTAEQKVAGEQGLQSALGRLLAVAEAYPELKAMYDPDDGNTVVYYFRNAAAVFSSFTEPPKTVTF